jgi:hypothetical protein
MCPRNGSRTHTAEAGADPREQEHPQLRVLHAYRKEYDVRGTKYSILLIRLTYQNGGSLSSTVVTLAGLSAISIEGISFC